MNRYIRQLILVRSAANALAFCMPALSTVIAVVVYVAIKHAVNPAAIFSGRVFSPLYSVLSTDFTSIFFPFWSYIMADY
jgi:hypothetical protein